MPMDFIMGENMCSGNEAAINRSKGPCGYLSHLFLFTVWAPGTICDSLLSGFRDLVIADGEPERVLEG